MKTLLQRKEELIAETAMLNRMLSDLDRRIDIYSAIDYVTVNELNIVKRELELVLLDVLTESNELYLQSIKTQVA